MAVRFDSRYLFSSIGCQSGYFIAGSTTVKFIHRDFVMLHGLDAFRVVATVDSGF